MSSYIYAYIKRFRLEYNMTIIEKQQLFFINVNYIKHKQHKLYLMLFWRFSQEITKVVIFS